MTERAYQPPFNSEVDPAGEGDIEVLENTAKMNRLLAIAVNSRQSGEPLEEFGAKQAEATRYINEIWPGDKVLQISFTKPAEVFERDGLHRIDGEKKSLLFQANRHAGFGQRGVLFVNDAANESVYVSEFFSTDLDFIKR